MQSKRENEEKRKVQEEALAMKALKDKEEKEKLESKEQKENRTK